MAKEKPAEEAKPEQAAAAAPAGESAAPVRHKMKRRNKILLIAFSLVMMALLRTGFVFFVIGMLPAIVVYYLDQSPNRYSFKTIFCCNLSGMLPFLGKLLHYGPSAGALQEVMSAPSTWFIIYGASAMGGLLIGITPLVARTMIDSLHSNQVSRLQRAQKKILQEWGDEVMQFGQSD